MAKTRREFKREAVGLLESSGRAQMQVAAELGIQRLMLRNWRAALKGEAPCEGARSKTMTIRKELLDELLDGRDPSTVLRPERLAW